MQIRILARMSAHAGCVLQPMPISDSGTSIIGSASGGLLLRRGCGRLWKLRRSSNLRDEQVRVDHHEPRFFLADGRMDPFAVLLVQRIKLPAR